MKCRRRKCECTDFNRRFCKDWVVEKEKKAGEIDVFREIWAEREHRCWLTGDRLLFFHPILFFHVLPKGGYSRWKTNKENILLMREDLHRAWHSRGREELLRSDPRWQRVFDLYEQLKVAYNGENVR